MSEQECAEFLQWCLPRMSMRWEGFRRVHKQVCKRLQRRIRELDLLDLKAYRRYLEQHRAEWHALDRVCQVTISRFYRDRIIYQKLEQQVLPDLAQQALKRGDPMLRCWSIGCASGEEPYSLALSWHFALSPRFPDLSLDIVATDISAQLLSRADKACYSLGSIKALPALWRDLAFAQRKQLYCLRPPWREKVRFVQQDVRHAHLDGPFDLVFCRNLVFTYYDEALQTRLARMIADCLRRGGALVLGSHESLPEAATAFERWNELRLIYRKR